MGEYVLEIKLDIFKRKFLKEQGYFTFYVLNKLKSIYELYFIKYDCEYEKKNVVLQIINIEGYQEYLVVKTSKYEQLLKDIENKKMSLEEYQIFLNSYPKAEELY